MPATRRAEAQAAKQSTREAILEAGVDLILQQGFNSTGLDAILKRVGIPKGSFYYYFKSKDDFGLQALQHYAGHYFSEMDGFLQAPTDDTPLKRLRQYLALRRQQFAEEGFTGGCLFGNLGQELSSQHPEFRCALQQCFSDWKSRLLTVFEAAQQHGEIRSDIAAADLVDFYMMALEGALMRAKVMQSTAPFEQLEHLFFDVLFKA